MWKKGKGKGLKEKRLSLPRLAVSVMAVEAVAQKTTEAAHW